MEYSHQLDEYSINSTSLESMWPNVSSTFQPTANHSDVNLIEFLHRFIVNRRLPDSVFIPLCISYTLLILFGTIANGLLIVLIFRQRARHQLRHLLMINLSISDLFLCVVTMPLTLIEIVCVYWPLGDDPILCKLTGCLEAVSVYCSTLTIAAIAVDRYHLIVYPTRIEGPPSLAVLLQLGSIWVGSALLALPLFIHRTLVEHPLDASLRVVLKLDSVRYCNENWPRESAAIVYSVSSTLFQFLIPMAILIFAHASIFQKLRQRFQGSSQNISRINNNHQNRNRRTNRLLSAIAGCFVLCWLPLNVCNLLYDWDFLLPENHQGRLIVFALCHLAGMSSACINPILYGWLNHNVRNEFHRWLRTEKSSTGQGTGMTITHQAPLTAVDREEGAIAVSHV